MECRKCHGHEFQKTSYGYHICTNCGSFLYEDNNTRKTPKPLSELYFVLIVGTGVMIITILILLFVTASSKKDRVNPVQKIPAVSTEKQ